MPTRSPHAAPQQIPDDPDEDRPSRGPLRRVLVALGVGVAVLSMGVWIYALFFYDPGLMIDELADRTFPRAAEQVCSVAREQIAALPTAEHTSDPAQRADTVDRANSYLREMTAALRPLVPRGEGKITSGIGEWIDDWDTFVADRQEYADALRSDPTVRFAETRKANRQISLAINAFAQVNRMESCTVPGDVG